MINEGVRQHTFLPLFHWCRSAKNKDAKQDFYFFMRGI